MELELFTTYGSGSWQEHFHQNVVFKQDEEAENQVVNLYPKLQYETLEGFGGAVTDAAGYVYSLMNEQQKAQVITTYFSPERMKYGIVRVHMDSCDFSTEMYEAMSDANDIDMTSFSFARTEKYIMPMLEDAQKAAGKPLELMLSPWSPPAFMKTNGQRTFGGSIKPEFQKMWADYICRYIAEFEKRGFKVRRMSLQNEPKAVQTWDSCVYTASQEKEFLKDYMYPALKAHHLEEVEIFIWDHNKERVFERLDEIVDEETDQMVKGVAFHWYSGDHFEALELVRQQYPDKKMIVSESCIEYGKFGGDSVIKSALRLSHEIIGDLNHGMTAFYDWNLLLDENGGPNHVGNFCHAPFLFDTCEKKLMPQLTQQYFEHFSHYLVPGSVGIAFSRYTEEIDVTAYKRPDGSVAVVLLNKADRPMTVNLRVEGQLAEMILYPTSITTGIIR
ncbi:MAG: glycoside hydrolase family 30 beta sandwich domain-containing protein [Lachnospiraceae bacterium]|nr:glycoside hydrolase family 30 beta sandwich domain-containing protein [Lachnospiraceae bacterium]